MSDIDLQRHAKLHSRLRRWREDILFFFHDALRIDPTPQQKGFILDFAKPGSFTSVKSGHGTGKTAGFCGCGIWHTTMFKPSKTIVFAPTYPQLKDTFIPEMASMLDRAEPWFAKQVRLLDDRLVVNGAEKLQFLSTRTATTPNTSSLQGARADYTAYIGDESFGVPDRAYETMMGASSKGGTDYGGRKSVFRMMLGGNPTTPVGFAADTFGKNRDGWNTHTLNSEDSPLVGKDYLEKMAKYKGTDIYRIRVLGQLPIQAENTLIPLAIVEAAAKRRVSDHDYKYAPIILGVDPAWMGRDRTAIFLRQGVMSKLLWVGNNSDNVHVAGLIHQFWSEYGADACFIDQGYGQGIYSNLKALKRNPILVSFGGSSMREDCYLKRTEIWVKMKEWLEEGGCIEDNPDLIEELSKVEYRFNLKAQKVLESKDSMRERLRSPDLADALALTFSFEVRQQNDPLTGLPYRMGANRSKKTYKMFKK